MKTLRKAIIVGVVLITATVALAKSVLLAWNPSSDATVTPLTYNVYIYTNDPAATGTNGAVSIYPTSDTNVVVSNLVQGTTYWANVDAEDTNGIHSDLSGTVAFTYPAAPMLLRVVP